MAFPFVRKVEHRVFPNTFLRKVIAYAMFETKHADFFDDGVMEAFQKYLMSMYNHDGVGEFPHKALEITSEDDNIEISFYNGGFLISFNQSSYTSFIDTVVPHLTRLRVFIEKVMQVEECEEMRVRKVNIWRFDPREDVDLNYELTSRAIFSDDLLNYPNKVALSEKEKTLPLKSKMEWSDGTKKLNLLTGFTRISDGATNLILDSEMIESATTPTSGMIDAMLHLNGTLFDVYQWSINDKVRNLMDYRL